ncbi:polysaccharide biosynthesis protein GumK [Roseibium sediminis]|uniref:GumK N-terminal domain-containing glycosyltransferase n=1 Tax=Roseibium sediminis TaxID=1775174 RepID=UPI003CC7FF67
MVLTSHVMLPQFRKTSLHFVVEEWARSGHTIYFTTVGYSALSWLKGDKRYPALQDTQRNRYVPAAPNIYCGAHLPLLHAFSSGIPLLSGLEMRLFSLYGNHLPDFITKRLEAADIVVLESGTPLAFFHRIKALKPSVRIIYFCRDMLTSIGASTALMEAEKDVVRGADLIVVPSPRIADQFELAGDVRFIPQGIDKSLFSEARQSPFPFGTKNGLVVGDMLFDQGAVAACAAANPDIYVHLFGINWHGAHRDNVIIHGEVSFETLVPYLQHADFGFAPYTAGPDEVYLAESSLKLLQYATCLLPTLLPENIPGSRGNEVRYSVDREPDWNDVVNAALRMPRDPKWREGILDWADVASNILSPLTDRSIGFVHDMKGPRSNPSPDSNGEKPIHPNVSVVRT